MSDYIQSYKWKDGSDEILVTYNNKVTGNEVTNKKKNNLVLISYQESFPEDVVINSKQYEISPSGIYTEKTLLEYGLSVLCENNGSTNFYDCFSQERAKKRNTRNYFYSPEWFGTSNFIGAEIQNIPASTFNIAMLNRNVKQDYNLRMISYNPNSKKWEYLTHEQAIDKIDGKSLKESQGFYIGYGATKSNKVVTSNYYTLFSVISCKIKLYSTDIRTGIKNINRDRTVRFLFRHVYGDSGKMSNWKSNVGDFDSGYFDYTQSKVEISNLLTVESGKVDVQTYLAVSTNNDEEKSNWATSKGNYCGKYYKSYKWNPDKDGSIEDFIKKYLNFSKDNIPTDTSPSSPSAGSSSSEKYVSTDSLISYNEIEYIQNFELMTVNWAECINTDGTTKNIDDIRNNKVNRSNCAFAVAKPNKLISQSITTSETKAVLTKDEEKDYSFISLCGIIDDIYNRLKIKGSAIVGTYSDNSLFLKPNENFVLKEFCLLSDNFIPDVNKNYSATELLSYKRTSFKDYFNSSTSMQKNNKFYYFYYDDNLKVYKYKEDFTSFSDFITELNEYLKYELKETITLDYVISQEPQELKLYSLEIFEAYKRGKDITNYDYVQMRPEELNSDGKRLMSKDDNYFTYKYSGRDFDLVNYRQDFNKNVAHICNNKMPISLVHSKDLLQETDVTLGDTYAYNRYFIEAIKYKDKNNNNLITYKDTFMIKDFLKTLDDRLYTEDDYKIVTANIDLSQCKYYHPNQATYENNWCDCNFIDGDKCTTECLYQKTGYCPYRFNTEKHPRRIRTLSQEKSNRFNIIQEASKVFEFYPYFYIEYDRNGKVKLDEDGKMKKHVCFLTEKGTEQPLGFRYEKNLSSITRTLNSESLTTRLYVENVDSELSSSGLCSIETAEDNIGKNSYIMNFSYYTQMGMLNEEQVKRDLYGIDKGDFAFLPTIGYYNKQYDNLTNLIVNMTGEQMTSLEAENIVNVTGITTALEERQKVGRTMYQFKTRMISKGQQNYVKTDTYVSYLKKYREQATNLYSNIEILFFSNDKFCFPIDIGDEENDYEPTWKIIDLNNNEYSYLKNYYCNGEIFWRLMFNGWKDEQDLPELLKNHTELLSYEPPYESWDVFKEKVVDKYYYPTCGKLGQYKSLKIQVDEWKKQKAKYLKKINELSTEFYQKYEPYIKEGTWTDDNYLTDNEYYWAAESVLNDSCKPQITYDIKVLDISPIPEYQDDYTFDLADTTFIEDIDFFGINKHTGLPNRQKVILTAIEDDLDLPNNNSITIQNYTTSFDELFEQITASVQSLTFNENTYKRASNFTSLQAVDSESLQKTLDDGQLTLLDANNNITLDDSGTEGKNITENASQYKLSGEGLYFSNDGGNSWDIGVGPKGINANYIKVGQLDSSKIQIMDNNYIYFLWDKEGITAYRNPSTSTQGLKDFTRFNRYGLSLIENGHVRLRTGYEFKTNERTIDGYNASGNYTDEQELSNQNIGFYLYNDKGIPIFKTETASEYNDSTADYSARLSLQGEIFATNDVLAGEDSGSTLVANTIYKATTGYIINQQNAYILGVPIEKEGLAEEMVSGYYIYNNIAYKLTTWYYEDISPELSDFGDTTSISSVRNYYIKIDNQYYKVQNSILINVCTYKTDSESSVSPVSATTINYYDFSENANSGILVTKSLFKTTGSVNGVYCNYWESITETQDIADSVSSAISTMKTGVFINNKKVNSSSNYEYADSNDISQSDAASKGVEGSERMFTACSLVTDENGETDIRNILTVLKNGYCYLGGKIRDQGGAKLSTLTKLDYLPDIIRVKEPAVLVGNNGYVFIDYSHTYGIKYGENGQINEYSLEDRLNAGSSSSGGSISGDSSLMGNYLKNPLVDLQ